MINGSVSLLTFSLNMVSQNERRLALICVALFVTLVLTSNYLYIVSTWRRPDFGYRLLLGSLFVFTVSSEIERLFGLQFLLYVPRISVAVLAVNFVTFEFVMLCRRKAFAKRMRVYDEQMLAEDRFSFEA